MIGTISIEDVVKGVVVNGENVVDYDGIAKIVIPDPPEVPVKDVKVDGESVVDSEGVANITIPDPPEIPVKDVKVDGESVVNAQGVANITLPDPPEVPVNDVKVNGESVVNAQGVANVVVPVISNLRVVKQLPGVPAAVVTASDAEAFTIPSLTVGVEAVQDLHGYDSPWVGGAGKNKVDIADVRITTQTTVAVKTLPAGTYVTSMTVKNNSNIIGTIRIIDSSGNLSASSIPADSGVNRIAMRSFTLSEPTEISIIVSGSSSGYDYETTQWQIELGTTATSYEPYSNICPISGWDEVDVTVADDVNNPTVSNVYTINLNGTRYGGRLEMVNGVARFVATKEYIASYNGETLPSDWISDRDVYSEGATPTIGAEVVYTLANPIIIPLANSNIATIKGINDIFANSGDILDGEYVSNQRVVNILN